MQYNADVLCSVFEKKGFCAINKNNIKSGVLDHKNNKLIYLRELLK